MNKPLFKHQAQSLKFMSSRDRVFDMSDPGTGKTRVEIEDFVNNRQKNRAMLVLAPRSILMNAWGNDLAEYAPDLKVSIAYADNRAEAFAEKADVYVTNLDAIKWVAAQKKEFFKPFERLVIDESSAFKHHTSDRSKALNNVKKYFDIRRNMTGTPNTRSITDIWNQMYFLDDGERLGKHFYAFRNAVATAEQVGRKAEMVKWTDKPGAHESVAEDVLAHARLRSQQEAGPAVRRHGARRHHDGPGERRDHLGGERSFRAHEDVADSLGRCILQPS
jgi:SNF2 family DNA or RNA helicase